MSAGDPAAPTPGESLAPLSRLVRQEAHRVLTEAQLAPDPARLAEGWERRFVADGPRCEEAMRLYAELGFEVCADPIRPEQLAGECEECQVIIVRQFRTIYTRAPHRRG